MAQKTNLKTWLVMAVFLLAFGCTIAVGDVIYVDDDGPADFNNIQAAINDSNDGDIIEVQPGTYTSPGNRDIDFLGKAITVRSIDPNDPNIVAATIIDCNGSNSNRHRGFKFQSDEGSDSVVAGLTITRGYANDGGGIYCYWSSPTITNCTISHNTTYHWSDGGGIYCKQSSMTINNCTISNNSTNGEGGGISCWWYSNPTITNCAITNNSANHNGGGGISCFRSAPIIVNCTISNNTARYGAGIFDGNPTVINCTISNNMADYNAGGGLQRCNGPITNCTITGNTGVYPGGGGLNRCNGPITNCIITNNTISNGDGGGLYRCNGPITNCIISGNSTSDDGGGIDFTSCKNTITNCTITGNRAGGFGGGIYGWWGGNATISNCILWDNTARSGHEIALDYDRYGRPCTLTVLYSDIQGGQADTRIDPTCTLIWGSGNINADPHFAFPHDYHLMPDSPCIDAGDNTAVPADTADLDGDGDPSEPIPFDIEGRLRFVDQPDVPDTGNGTAPIVDMGAFEANYIEVRMKFTPQALNLNSKGRWLKSHLVLPEGFVPEDVDTNTPAVIEPLDIESDYMNVFINEDGLVEIEAAFSRADFCGSATTDETTEVIVIGLLTSGQNFYGIDTIKIINKSFEYLAVFTSHWLQTDCSKPDWCGSADVDQDSAVNLVDFAMFDGCCIEVIKK